MTRGYVGFAILLVACLSCGGRAMAGSILGGDGTLPFEFQGSVTQTSAPGTQTAGFLMITGIMATDAGVSPAFVCQAGPRVATRRAATGYILVGSLRYNVSAICMDSASQTFDVYALRSIPGGVSEARMLGTLVEGTAPNRYSGSMSVSQGAMTNRLGFSFTKADK